jgi:hypothetical protein
MLRMLQDSKAAIGQGGDPIFQAALLEVQAEVDNNVLPACVLYGLDIVILLQGHVGRMFTFSHGTIEAD